jgi:ABC-type transporter Mla maintaining outer membrane lipid asymmetry ATPase subunit MlaF
MCLEAAYIGKYILTVLPTGYGKSVIFHLLPSLLAEKKGEQQVFEEKIPSLLSFSH